jgi:hypothetical protein
MTTYDPTYYALIEIINKLYGPKFCTACGKVQAVCIFQLQGTTFSKVEGTTFTHGFTGSYVCGVCNKPIEDQSLESGK